MAVRILLSVHLVWLLSLAKFLHTGGENSSTRIPLAQTSLLSMARKKYAAGNQEYPVIGCGNAAGQAVPPI